VVRQHLQAGSRTIAYLDSAPGDRSRPALLLLHAFPLGAHMWEPQFRDLARDARIIAPDLRGFGGSSDPLPAGVGPSIDDFADDAIVLIRELGIGPVILAGLSMGGYAAFSVMRRAPDLVRSLILSDTRASADTLQARAGRKAMLALVEREGPQGVARDMMPKLLGRTTRERNPDAQETVRRLIKRHSPQAIHNAVLRMMERPDARPLLPSISVPTLVIVGEEDELTPPSAAEEIAQGIPGATLVRIAGAGHLPNLEQSGPFDASIQAFLQQS
jgi:3-oxoadipate enol-lactonase